MSLPAEPSPLVCPELLAVLTPAERLVVTHLCEGLANKEIASVLGKSEATVKFQVSSAMAKLGVPTRTRLMVLLRG